MNFGKVIKRDVTKQAARFLVIGFISTAINYSLFLILFLSGFFNYLFSSGLGYISGMIFGFYYNRKVTFYSKEGIKKSLLVYLIVYIGSLLISLYLLDLFVEKYNSDVLLTNLLLLILTTLTNFFGVKIFAFRNKDW
jgi:putative flippase GtrA